MTDGDDAFEALLRYLKETRGFDFTGYKRASLMRRFRRQMASARVESFEEYQDYLQVHPEEFTALFNTILINVTGFFRDADAWAHLQGEIVPALVQAAAGGPLRIWSAGCASGEEAYTLAMVMAEVMGVDDFRRQVKIYATDVDEEALAVARQATYSDRQVRGVPSDLLARYFDSGSGRFTFRPELRRAVIFGRNDLVQDAPISRVDLLVCRNTLMYFNAETQAQMLNRLHFALKPEGVLFLGKAEMLLTHGALFTPIDLKRRYFRKVSVLPGRDRRPPTVDDGDGSSGPTGAARAREVALLASPVAQVVLDADGRLAMSNHRADALFGLGPRDTGRPFQDLEVSYRPVELRSFIEEAQRDRRPVWARDVEWQRVGAEPQFFEIQVVPLLDEGSRLVGSTVIFNDVTRYRQLQSDLQYANRQLETAYEELQSTNEELETTNEELQSTVEELETTNEELQSTNEELETMNEELQSMNDELHASNEELRSRTSEVSDLNQFTESVLAGLRAGVAVVDQDLRILAWNPRAEDLWGVRQDEAVGQHLLNLDIGLPVERLRPLLRRQLGSDEPVADHEGLEVPAINRRGRSMQVRVTVTALPVPPARGRGAILVMDQLEG